MVKQKRTDHGIWFIIYFLHIDMVNMPLLEWVGLPHLFGLLSFLGPRLRTLIRKMSRLHALEEFNLTYIPLPRTVAIVVVMAIVVV
jgi:hypothetical protein